MIRYVHVRNFQRHKNLKIKLDPYVTTIVGPSDVGKSALLRTIIWISLNKPRGASFLRDGAKHVTVKIRVGRHTIRRSKGKTNTYHLDNHKFSAIGNDVPQEISSLLKVSDINFQGQHDSPFWFSEAPGEVSRKLNQIVDLSLIDTTLANLSSSTRKAKAERDVVQERLMSSLNEKRKLRHVRELHRMLSSLEAGERELAEKAERIDTLQGILEKAATYKAVVTRLAQGTPEPRFLAELEVLHHKWKSTRKQATGLETLVETGSREQTKVTEFRKEIAKLHKKLKHRIGDICPLCGSQIKS